MNGIYAIYFTGAFGSGHGVLLLRNGAIAGADASGVLYDGSYRVEGNGEILRGSVRMMVPPGAGLVTGAAAGSEPLSFDIPLALPTHLGNGRPLLLQTPTGPVNIIFKRLRGVE